ncbi:hypothetical protein EKH55_1675 [Sinorhizobium alkalisoli]|nr:hypothetical protein EKH55_1675 [Sinorhizobium alkalisoli]
MFDSCCKGNRHSSSPAPAWLSQSACCRSPAGLAAVSFRSHDRAAARLLTSPSVQGRRHAAIRVLERHSRGRERRATLQYDFEFLRNFVLGSNLV